MAINILFRTLAFIACAHTVFAWTPCPPTLSLSFQQRGGFLSMTSSSSSVSPPSTAAARLEQRDGLVSKVLSLARKLGPVGSDQSEQDQQQLLDLAMTLKDISDPQPARVPLSGTHSLVYSASKGGSSGKLIGPVHGNVRQEFVDASLFYNIVELGPLKITLTATREIISDETIRVKFLQTVVSMFGKTIVEKDISGTGGVWKMIFVGVVKDEETGQETLARIFLTPSLFVVEQPL